jgi:DNA modification methylase
MRLRAAKAEGYKQVPVVVAEGLTDEQIREFIIKDNLAFGDWDWEAIQVNWPEAPDWGLEVPDKFKVIPEGMEDEWEMPAEIATDIVLGDLFEIGEHRLLCGSSTNANDVSKLLNGKEPYLMVTDPPYGVKYDPTWRHRAGIINSGRIGKVQNDDNADWYDAWILSPSKVAYVWHASLFTSVVMDSLERAGFEHRNQIIWNKSQMVFGQGHYHWKHEPCWYVVKKGSKGNWAGDRKQTTVWEIDGILKSSKQNTRDEAQSHGTQKPVECMSRPISNHDGDVYDPFLGSGTTMVAAHQLNRKCYGMELEPKYCQGIVDRMRKLDPSLMILKNGVPL